ncbi:MAG TPA: hypothetical protein VFJ10_04395, partial [Acidobacteriaceae bacterium]|nr:hypothetical protein [Acidobacteriaceae bacterium]
MTRRDKNSELRRRTWALRRLSAGVVAMTLGGAVLPLSLRAQENSIAAPPALQTGPVGVLDASGS